MAPTLPASASHPDVVEFLNLWNLKDPIYLDYEDIGYAADFCHVSAKHMTSKNGGSRVHGWALWLFHNPAGSETIIIGNFHSVWADAGGTLHDVTPPKVGNRILFVRDPALTIMQANNSQRLYNNRTSFKEVPRMDLTGGPIQGDYYWMPNDNAYLVE